MALLRRQGLEADRLYIWRTFLARGLSKVERTASARRLTSTCSTQILLRWEVAGLLGWRDTWASMAFGATSWTSSVGA